MKTKQENNYVLHLQYRIGQLENVLAEILVETRKQWNEGDNEACVCRAWSNAHLILNEIKPTKTEG